MKQSGNTSCVFHHVQVYTKRLESLNYYKALEESLNGLANAGRFDPFSGGMRFLEPRGALPERIEQGREIWENIIRENRNISDLKPENYSPVDQDLVEQLIVGLGWRVTAEHIGVNTRSMLVTSLDACGVKLVVTAIDEKKSNQGRENSDDEDAEEGEYYDHFDASHLTRFYNAHKGREGVAVLGFELGTGTEIASLPFGSEIERVFNQYVNMHPRLLVSKRIFEYSDVRTKKRFKGKDHGITLMRELGKMKVFEAFAYYQDDERGEIDTGTVIRFIERKGSYASQQGFGNPQGVLPGLVAVQYAFDGTSIPAYSDHWVSNVHNRNSFLKTLNDVLGFTPKVDFNAGVVAAGRAKIESTVTGNDAPLFAEFSNIRGGSSFDSGKTALLKNQTQVYLPINNALSDIGHVHGFLQEIGQGVQHLANRVENLVLFIERANNYRRITGRGFSFLRIPRSYYGHLDTERDILSALNKYNKTKGKENAELAEKIFKSLVTANIVTLAGIVDLDVSHEEISKYVSEYVDDAEAIKEVCENILRARYYNMYSLLRDHLSERTYLQIVRNKVLVDIQGHDILYQIFTSNILQRNIGDEAPFLEFIQRVCSEKKDSCGMNLPIKPGCGGFGIRNFLTLFLSIEVSKAMDEFEKAVESQNKLVEEYAKAKIDLFTKQLNESNPVLTEISDAMTQEAEALEKITKLESENANDKQEIEKLMSFAKKMNQKKTQGNEKLQKISSSYVVQFKDLEVRFKENSGT